MRREASLKSTEPLCRHQHSLVDGKGWEIEGWPDPGLPGTAWWQAHAGRQPKSPELKENPNEILDRMEAGA